MASDMIGVVTGLAAEARLARGLAARIDAGGGDERGAEQAAERLVAAGCGGLVSFGLAGGLDPDLAPGSLVIPETIIAAGSEAGLACDPALLRRLGGATQRALLGGGPVLASAAAKRDARARTGAAAVDLESGAAARIALRHGLPFAALRAVCDPAWRDLPQAALVALDAHGRIGPLRVLAAVARRPADIPALIALARDAARARRGLLARVRAIGRL